MWPHHILIGVADLAVSVASDDATVIERLEPWRIGEAGELIDYGARLFKDELDERGAPKTLARLQRGSEDIGRSRDPDLIVDALLRVLAAHTRPPQPRQLRVKMTALVRDGRALLVPSSRAEVLPEGWLRTRNVRRLLVETTLVDVDAHVVLIDPPFGSRDEPLRYPIHGWWVSPERPSDSVTTPQAVAELMRVVDGVQPSTAQRTLELATDVARRMAPRVAAEESLEVQMQVEGDLSAHD